MINWAEMNPFSRADRGQTGGNTTPVGKQQNKGGKGEPDPNGDPSKIITDPNAQTGDDPLLKFDSLWQPNKDKDGKDIPETNDDDTPFLPALDSKQFDGMVNKMEFHRGIPAETWKAIQDGGEGAVAAMAQIMNHVGRQAFRHSFNAANRITEAGFTSARTRFRGEIPNHVRDIVTDTELSDIPYARNPALAPIVKSVKTQYLSKFPKATPSEINNAIREYFKYIGTQVNTKQDDDNKQAAR
jgi:hypothetical protein